MEPNTLTHYPVYLPAFFSGKLDHHAIYVDIDKGTGGLLFNVEGSLQNGMKFKTRRARHPFANATGKSIQPLGWVLHEALDEVKAVCMTIPAPVKQWHHARRLVPLDQVRHCQHWAAEAVGALRDRGVLEPLGPGDHDEVIVRKVCLGISGSDRSG